MGSAFPAAAAGVAAKSTSQTIIARAPLAESLVRTAPTTPPEDLALAQALTSYAHRTSADDDGPLTAFVARYPKSGWTPAVLTNLGLTYLHDGYFSRAIDAWRGAWELGKGATDPHARALIDRAAGELARLYASLGQFDKLAALFEEIGTRPISGSATEAVQTAREELTLVGKDPRHLFNCGPIALKMVMLALDPRDLRGAGLEWYRASPNGTSLAELSGLATKANSSYRVVFRTPGQPVPFPSVVHWKVGHYGAIVGRANGRYHVEEPAIPGGLWVTQAALDAEASGYFLIPASAPNDTGWRSVELDEAAKVWGKGPTNGVQPGDANDPKAHGKKGKGNCGMCVYDIKEATVGVTLSDTPVGYDPPIGISTRTEITYNQREDSQPANFNFFNVSPKWTLNWLAYVIDDPTNPGANVSRYLSGGGAYYYSGYNSGTGQFSAENGDGSILVLVSTSPITYHRQLADGSVEVYAQSNGAPSYPRNIFLSQIIDPQGNALTLNYDGQMRLTSLTDAAGRQTSFTYGNANPLLVTTITDPFGRSASLAYDTSGRLSSITDVLGLTSSFAYDANSLVDSMTTPYGTTGFAYTAPGTAGPPRFVQVTDPLSYNEREEWLEPAPIPDSDPGATVPAGMPLSPTNQYLSYRDSFYWDRNAYVVAGCTPTGGCDYTKARDTHFLHVPNQSIKSTSVESVKYPLENRIWSQYPGQTNSIYAGTFQQPIAVGRVLDDGTTQLTQYAFDIAGYFKPTQAVDPIGRTTSFAYAANRIDLTTITQLVNGMQTTLDQYTWNGEHRPLTHVDAAGKTTTFGYNAAGQLTSVTNALNQKTSYGYNTTGDLTSITNANTLTQASYTYDAFDRVATFTDSEGWVVSFAYDAADRITTVTYPDSTTEVYGYNKLDLASYQDRLGRTWTYAHDADRRLTSTTDPSTHQIIYAYNPSDELTSLTDANSHITQWAYDVEGRQTTKTYADNSTLTFGYETTTSRLKSTTDALTQVRQLAYAKDDQVTGLTYTNAVHATPNVTFAYDLYFPRRTSMTDGSGTTTYTYVPAGTLGALQVQQVATPLTNGTIAYTYDALGRLSTRTVAGQGAESYGYDAIGRVTSHASDLGSFTLAWLGQTRQIASRSLASSSLATSWSYLANSGDRRLASVATTGTLFNQSTSFAYTTNAQNEATGLTQTSDASIATPAASSQSASYNNLNQLTNLGSQAFTFDADGNLTSDGTRTYSWDAENRLVAISYPGQGSKATAFAYDGLGRRIQWSSTPRTGGAVITKYIWCGASLCQARNSSNAVIRGHYAEGEYTPGGFTHDNYYAPDRLGSVRRVFATTSSSTYDYDAYGAALQTTAPTTDFGYAGTVTNTDSGLYLTTARPYDPATGRFLTRDPIGEAGDPQANLYAYVGDDPVDGADPGGLCKPAKPKGCPARPPANAVDAAGQSGVQLATSFITAGESIAAGSVPFLGTPAAPAAATGVALGEGSIEFGSTGVILGHALSAVATGQGALQFAAEVAQDIAITPIVKNPVLRAAAGQALDALSDATRNLMGICN